jgi:prepilin-type N-terminal cleavage/methylation domain-containing protein/prepilin-type processing-associated H-X9-DG protein
MRFWAFEHRRRPCRKYVGARHGFTLIELLVSVTIISILAAVLIPAVMQSRSATRRTICQSNLRQWSLAVRMYADSHHGRLPFRGGGIKPVTTSRLNGSDDWFNALPVYVETAPYSELATKDKRPKPGDESVWMCPDAEPVPNHLLPTTSYDSRNFFAYGMNMALSTPFMGRPDHIDRIGELKTMVFMADGLGPFCSVIPHNDDFSTVARHIGNTVNIAFMDGRVESFAGDEVGCRIGDPQRPEIRWWPPNSTWPGPPK